MPFISPYFENLQMLKLKNVEGRIELELSVAGYDPPQSSTTNWCNLKVLVTQDEDVFEETFPAIETTDITKLSTWFQRLAERQLPRFARLSFTEPCIQLAFLAYKEPTVRISVRLSHELKPSFKIKQFRSPFDNPEWEIVFELNDEDFRTIICNLEQIETIYPVRLRC